MAVIVDNISELNDNIENLLDGRIEVHTIQENAYNYLVQDRVIKVIQEGIYRRIKNTVNNN